MRRYRGRRWLPLRPLLRKSGRLWSQRLQVRARRRRRRQRRRTRRSARRSRRLQQGWPRSLVPGGSGSPCSFSGSARSSSCCGRLRASLRTAAHQRCGLVPLWGCAPVDPRHRRRTRAGHMRSLLRPRRGRSRRRKPLCGAHACSRKITERRRSCSPCGSPAPWVVTSQDALRARTREGVGPGLATGSVPAALHHLSQTLQLQPWVRTVTPLPRARIPVLKVRRARPVAWLSSAPIRAMRSSPSCLAADARS